MSLAIIPIVFYSFVIGLTIVSHREEKLRKYSSHLPIPNIPEIAHLYSNHPDKHESNHEVNRLKDQHVYSDLTD